MKGEIVEVIAAKGRRVRVVVEVTERLLDDLEDLPGSPVDIVDLLLPVEPKPPTQTVAPNGAEDSKVMQPSTPPPGFVRAMALVKHPWFQSWVGLRNPAMVEKAGGDSLKAAAAYVAANVCPDPRSWDEAAEKRMAVALAQYEEWCKTKGYPLDEA